jgi:hypothetical protein
MNFKLKNQSALARVAQQLNLEFKEKLKYSN